MFRTIFRKQLTLFLSVFIIGAGILGALTALMISGYYTDRTVESLESVAEKIASQPGIRVGVFDRGELQRDAAALKRYMDASLVIIFTDSDMRVYTESSVDNPNAELDISEMADAAEGKTVVVKGKLNGMFNEAKLNVVYPVYANGTHIATIVLSSSLSQLNETVGGMIRITVICTMGFVLVGFVLIYVFSRSLSKPLREMSEAAKIIARGDFEKRISVKTKDEIGQLAESLNNMAADLSRQEKDRRDFIANISHDLRSPLTSIHGFIEAIIDGTAQEDKRGHYLGIVLDETDRLAKLTTDIVDLNRAQFGDAIVDLTTFDINALIRETAAKFENRVKAKGAALSLKFEGETCGVRADREKIQRVVYNLLDNAVKFTPAEGGVIEVFTERKGGKLWVSVRDNGRGISAENQKKVFDRFFKADASRGEDKKGSGVGLAIVKEFIRAHKERVEVESEAGKGCVFRFSVRPAKE